jgi:hypothetical protein
MLAQTNKGFDGSIKALQRTRLLRSGLPRVSGLLRRPVSRVAETMQDLDVQFGRIKPDIPELLARYFTSHPESFPV